eukprot:SM000015S01302  [mRNA]  locus=s15:1248084:1249498:+ [translate_table: standard]
MKDVACAGGPLAPTWPRQAPRGAYSRTVVWILPSAASQWQAASRAQQLRQSGKVCAAKSFEAQTTGSEQAVLVEFYHAKSADATALTSAVTNLAERFKDQLSVVKVDTFEDPDTTSQYEVSNIPQFLLFKKGQLVERMSDFSLVEEAIKTHTSL